MDADEVADVLAAPVECCELVVGEVVVEEAEGGDVDVLTTDVVVAHVTTLVESIVVVVVAADFFMITEKVPNELWSVRFNPPPFIRTSVRKSCPTCRLL